MARGASESEHPLMLYVVVFLGGAALMALEVLAFRIVGRTFGLAVRETSVVIAGFLTAMSIGYVLGGKLADAFPSELTLAAILGIVSLFIAAVVPLDEPVSDRIFASKLPIELHAALVTMTLFVVPVLLLSMVTPFGVRLRSAAVGRAGSVAGLISGFSTAGSIAGSLCTALIAFNVFNSVRRTLVLLASVTLLSAIALVLTASRTRRTRSWTAFVLIGMFLATGAAVLWLDPHTAPEVLFEQDSAFHHIIVRDVQRTRVLQFGRVDQHTQSAMSLDDPLLGGAEYTDFSHMPVALRGAPARVLFLGVGGGTGPKRFVHDYPSADVDAVDVDPMVLEVARRFFGLHEGTRLHLHAEDGRSFIRRSASKYDLIVIDAFTTTRYGSTVAPHLTTREFFHECAAHLAPGGIVVFNSAAPPGQLLTRAVSRTLRSVFPSQLAFITTAGGNVELLASNAPLEIAPQALRSRIADLRARGVIRFPGLEQRAMQMEPPIDTAGVPLLTDDSAPADSLPRFTAEARP